jgi:5-methylcytosine-specific restriction enzyme B
LSSRVRFKQNSLSGVTMTPQQERFFADRVVPLANQIETWRPRVIGLLDQLQRASSQDWQSEPFLRELWASEAVSATGQGKVSVDTALENQAFRQWFGTAAQGARLLTGQQQVDALKVLFDELLKRFQGLGLPRMPRLKINRVLAALAPKQLTTLANPGTRDEMYRWATGSTEKGIHPIDQQVEIRRVIDDLAKPYPQLKDARDLTTFMLPWIAFESLTQDRKQVKPDPKVGHQGGRDDSPVNNAPTKTFLAVGDGIQRPLEICDMVSMAPLSDEDVYESLQERYGWEYAWAKQVANFLASSVGILSRDGGTFQLSTLGAEFLRTKSGDVLSEQLVRNFVGVDHVLVALKEGPKLKSELVTLLRRANPKAKSDFGPNTTLSWLVMLGAVILSKGEYSLTPSGYKWVELVKWAPTIASVTVDATSPIETTAVETETPKWEQVAAHFATQAASDGMAFDTSDLLRIHLGLWNDDVRHFCILTGLSGAGKTQMAVRYANAVVAAAGEDESCVAVVPVQPDWAEPSHLLGFRHPLDATRYQSTQFLEILLRAHDNPTKPHFVILDEMNLAHPELYLAPVLSAMETEGNLWLHQSEENASHNVPASVRYPRNLAIIGTINMDETTHALSDKVLDRAAVVPFTNVNLNAFQWSTYASLGERLTTIREVLIALYDALFPVGLHFAYRVVKSIVNQVAFAIDQLGQEAAENWIRHFDSAIESKVLPKLRGEDSKELRFAMDSIYTTLSSAELSNSASRVDTLRIELARDGVLKYWR